MPNLGDEDEDIKRIRGFYEAHPKNKDWKPPAKKAKPEEELKVPNFGVDQDVVATQASVDTAEKQLKHKWKPERDENGSWIVPEPHVDYTKTGIFQGHAE